MGRLQPWLLCGMTALLVARPLFPSESAAAHGDGLPMVMLWISLCVLWLLGAIGRPKFSICFGWTDAAVLLLIGWHSLAAIWATGHGSPRPAINMLWEWIGMGLCFLLARQFVATPREARAVVAVMVALSAGLSGYGLYQRTYELPQTRAEYAWTPTASMRDAGVWFPAGSRERWLFESRLENREPLATFALTNSLAAFLSPWLVVLVGIGLGSRRNRKRLAGMGLCLIPIATCLLLTKSRSGYIAGCVGLVLVWLLCRERPVRIGWKLPAAALSAAALLLAAALAIEGPDVLDNAWKSFAFRVQYWQASVRMIGEHPLVGCGPGNFQNAYTQYKLPRGGRGGGRSAQFPAGNCGDGRPARRGVLRSRVGVLFRRNVDAWKRRGEGGKGNRTRAAGSGRSTQDPSFKIESCESPIPNPQSFPRCVGVRACRWCSGVSALRADGAAQRGAAGRGSRAPGSAVGRGNGGTALGLDSGRPAAAMVARCGRRRAAGRPVDHRRHRLPERGGHAMAAAGPGTRRRTAPRDSRLRRLGGACLW